MVIRNRLKATFPSAHLRKGYVGEHAVNHIGIQIKVKDERLFFEWKSFMSAHMNLKICFFWWSINILYAYPLSFFRTKEEIDTFKKFFLIMARKF